MTRVWTIAFAVALALTSLTFVGASSSAPTPAAPTQLAQHAGNYLPADGWTNRAQVDLQFRGVGTGRTLIPQVELEPAGHAFTNHETDRGTAQTIPRASTATFSVVVQGFRNGGMYHWQARLVDDHGPRGAMDRLRRPIAGIFLKWTHPFRPRPKCPPKPTQSGAHGTGAELPRSTGARRITSPA